MIILSQRDRFVDYYTFSDTSVTKHRYFNGMYDALQRIKKSTDECYLLLKESDFFYHTFSITLTSREKFSINEFKEIIQEKLLYIKRKYSIQTEYSVYSVDNCTVGGLSVEHIIGKQGTISFDLRFVIVHNEVAIEIKKACGSDFLTGNRLTIAPRSYYIIKYLDIFIAKKECSFLFIDDSSVDIITINRGFYHRVEGVNMGESLLRECYNEHNIQQYLYEGYEMVEKNEILRKLVEESLLFYTQQLCGWMQQYLLRDSDLFVVSNLVDNPLFIDVLGKQYHATVGGFLAPLGTVFRGIGVQYKYTHAEIPIIATAMLAKKKQKH